MYFARVCAAVSLSRAVFRLLPVLASVAMLAAAGAAGAASLFDEDKAIAQAVDAIKGRLVVPHPRVLKVTITANEVAIQARNPEHRQDIDEWKFVRLDRHLARTKTELLPSFFWSQRVVGPQPVQVNLSDAEIEDALFFLDDVDFTAAAALIKAAVARAGLEDPGQVTGMEIARQALILPRRSGEVSWTVAVSSGRESAQIIANGQGRIIGADLDNTNRQRNLNLFQKPELTADFVRDFRAAFGAGEILTEVGIARNAVSFTTNLPDEQTSLGMNLRGSWNLGGLRRNVIGAPRQPFQQELPFGIDAAAWQGLAKLPATAREALGMPQGMVSFIELSKSTRRCGPPLLMWEVEVTDANGQKGSVWADMSGAVKQVLLPESRRKKETNWTDPQAIVDALARVERELGEAAQYAHLMFYIEKADITSPNPQKPDQLMECLLSDAGLTRVAAGPMMPPVTALPGERRFTIPSLGPLTANRIADLEKRTLAAIDLSGLQITRVTFAHNFFDPSPKGNVTVEVRAEVPPFNAPSPPGGRSVYELDGTLIHAYTPHPPIPEALKKAMAADAAHDYPEALRQYDAVQAQYTVGVFSSRGFSRSYNYEATLPLFRKAAEQGLAVAQFLIGERYLNSQGVGKADAEALRWFLKSAEQGVKQAQYAAGVFYLKGETIGQNYDEALRWFRKAADQGFAPAQREVGEMYGQGQGTRVDYAEAMRWVRLAADQGDAIGLYDVGMIHANGLGVPRDMQQARPWMEKSAAAGFDPAKQWLRANPR